MPIVFPTSPVVGQVFSSGGRSWVWNGATWDSPRSDNPPLAIPTGNVIINGGFDIWQRGTSFSPGATYAADRWFISGNDFTITRQSATPPEGSRYYSRITATSSNSYANHWQGIETQNVAPLWGKTITISAKVRRNSTMQTTLAITFQKNAAVDASMAGGGWTTISSAVLPNASITTGTGVNDWTNLVLTTVVPSDGTANSVRILIGEGVVMPIGSIWELANVQLEAGAVATPFRRNAPSIQAELAACQRYYQRITPGGLQKVFTTGSILSATQIRGYIQFPVPMRIEPAALEQTGTASEYAILYKGPANLDCNGVPTFQSAHSLGIAINFFVASGTLTSGESCQMRTSPTTGQNAYLGWSAEL